jgi:hypothetical protein
VEQSKVAEFLGLKSKATISALHFMCCIDDMDEQLENTIMYNNFANALRGIGRKWLFSMVNMLDYTADQLTWTNLKPRFQKQFAVQ